MEEALQDVEFKFIMNLPESELQTSERLFFQIEQAHWYFLDFLADAPNSQLPQLNLRKFALKLFEFSELLQPLRSMYDEFFQDFMEYKGKIPTYGCILLNPQLDKMVLVCNWKGTSWSFPKGKLNEGEDGAACAVREVEEETGFRAPPTDAPASSSAGGVNNLPSDEDALTVVLDGGQRSKMFIVPGVPEDFPFEPQVRKEISKIQFFPIDQPHKKAWNVSQFLPALKRWVKDHRRKLKKMVAQASKKNGGGASGGSQNSTPTRNQLQNSAPLPREYTGVGGGSGGTGGNGCSGCSGDGLTASVASLFGSGGGGGEGGPSSGGDLCEGGGGGEAKGAYPVEASVAEKDLKYGAPLLNSSSEVSKSSNRPPRAPPQKRKVPAATNDDNGGNHQSSSGVEPTTAINKVPGPSPAPSKFTFDVADIMAAIDGATKAKSPPPPKEKAKPAKEKAKSAAVTRN